MDIRFSCPYKETELEWIAPFDRPYLPSMFSCPCQDKVCYIVQDDEKRKEVSKMDRYKMKEARCMENGLRLAVDDIVDIKTTRMSKSDYTGRIAKFTQDGILLDTSDKFNSSTITIDYCTISNIEFHVGEETDNVDCN